MSLLAVSHFSKCLYPSAGPVTDSTCDFMFTKVIIGSVGLQKIVKT